jgi:flavin-dependent dehydrogenase
MVPSSVTMSSAVDEEFEIIICGCGPTGALLSANLGRLGVRHLILEKESDITTDPRGIVLDEDGIRSLQGVGKYEALFRDVGKCESCESHIAGVYIANQMHSCGNVPLH